MAHLGVFQGQKGYHPALQDRLQGKFEAFAGQDEWTGTTGERPGQRQGHGRLA